MLIFYMQLFLFFSPREGEGGEEEGRPRVILVVQSPTLLRW